MFSTKELQYTSLAPTVKDIGIRCMTKTSIKIISSINDIEKAIKVVTEEFCFGT